MTMKTVFNILLIVTVGASGWFSGFATAWRVDPVLRVRAAEPTYRNITIEGDGWEATIIGDDAETALDALLPQIIESSRCENTSSNLLNFA